MSANRNRSAGHNYEREIVLLMKSLGWDQAVTSRSESKRRDDAGVDLCFTDPFNIQCKNNSKRVNYIKVLELMPQNEDNINVIFERKTEKKGTRFFKQGDYVHLSLEDFVQLIKMIKNDE